MKLVRRAKISASGQCLAKSVPTSGSGWVSLYWDIRVRLPAS